MLKGNKNKKNDKKRNTINEEGKESGSEHERDSADPEVHSPSNTKSLKNKKKEKDGIQKLLAKKNELKLHKIILENFKSFEGVHEIGYFLNFSVVLGPNGSGKSNIIDAICFALGMKTISLRTKNLRDLVYKRESDDDNSKRPCSVQLVFTKDGEELTFKRTITTKGSSEFYSKDSKVTSDDYLTYLERLDIPYKARYFILVQGAIDSILSKKNDLTETIEFLSDSYVHKEDYDKVKSEIKTLNDEIGKLSTEMHSIKDDRNRVKSQIENEEKYNELVNKLNVTLNRMYLYKLAEMDSIIKTSEELYVVNEESLKNAQDEKKSIIDFIKANETDVRKVENELKKSGVSDSKKIHLEEIGNKLSQVVENVKLHESQIFGKTSMLNQYNNDKKRKDEKKNSLLSQYKILEKQISEVKKIIDNDSIDLGKNDKKFDKETIEEYREISNQFEVQSFGNNFNKDYEKIQINLAECNNQKIIIEKNLSKIENEKSALENELKINSEIFTREEVNKGKHELENMNNKGELSIRDAEKTKLESDWEVNYKLLNEKLVQLSNFETENLENVKRKKISELMNRNSLVFGFLYELITPLQKKLELPIKVSLLKFLNYLVVENSDTAKACSEYLKSKEINADILILENIPEKSNDESIRLRLGNLGNLVTDLIDCKKKGLKNALNYFLKDLVMCYDKENVSKIKSKGLDNIILIDGTVFKKGTIRGGTYKSLEQFSFNYKQTSQDEIEKLRKEVEALSKLVGKIEEKRNDYKELNALRNKIIEKENQIELHSKNLVLYSENVKRLTNIIKQKEQLLNELEIGLNKVRSEYNELSQKLSEVNKKRNELKEEIFKNFIEKHNLVSLKEFEPFSLSEVKRLSEELKSFEEKLIKIESQIKILEGKDELVLKLEKSLDEEKEKKKVFEKEREAFEKEFKLLTIEYEKFQKAKDEEYKKISNQKELLKLKQLDLDQIDKRIRSLIKNKIEYEHKISNSIDNKRNIIEESKLNIDSYMRDLNNITQTYSVFVSFNVDVERFIFATETKLNKTNLVIDYTDIETKRKIYERSLEGHREKVGACRTKFGELMKELERYVKLCSLNENESNRLKDKEEELGRKKKQTLLQVQNLVNELESKKEEFEIIKKERKTKFESFFKDLSGKLGSTYKELTTPQDSMSPGGSAYIYNTNDDEPYLGTVCYLPTPPGKRVIYDIDQLSGGEKTIAILSLVISIQSIRFTPFIILDEIDSYLDPEHEGILERLFKTQNKNFQIIIVTHKSNIFRSAESLIGTYFNKQKFSSIPISVDMTKIY